MGKIKPEKIMKDLAEILKISFGVVLTPDKILPKYISAGLVKDDYESLNKDDSLDYYPKKN